MTEVCIVECGEARSIWHKTEEIIKHSVKENSWARTRWWQMIQNEQN